MVSRTTRATLADGREVVIKRCPYPVPQEANGLHAMADAGVLVPAVIGVSQDVLVLEHVGGEPDWEQLGRRVGVMHRCTADRFGWPEPTWVGLFSQSNQWFEDWPSFYAECRVLRHLREANVSESLRRRIEAACAGPLRELLRTDAEPSLTHGDLWIGNVVDGRWLIDPSVSFADRELDVATISFSADYPPEFLAAYEAEYPLAPGFADRRMALTLHRQLVNFRHFGSRVLLRLEEVLDHYGW
jgi:protein-ribulosamine 3-kinase